MSQVEIDLPTVSPKQLTIETTYRIDKLGRMNDEEYDEDDQDTLCSLLAYYLLSNRQKIPSSLNGAAESQLLCENDLISPQDRFSYVASKCKSSEIDFDVLYDLLEKHNSQYPWGRDGNTQYGVNKILFNAHILKSRIEAWNTGVVTGTALVNEGHGQDAVGRTPWGGFVVDGVSQGGAQSTEVANRLADLLQVFISSNQIKDFASRVETAIESAQFALETRSTIAWERGAAATYCAYEISKDTKNVAIASTGDCRIFEIGKSEMISCVEPDDIVKQEGNQLAPAQKEIIRDLLERLPDSKEEFVQQVKNIFSNRNEPYPNEDTLKKMYMSSSLTTQAFFPNPSGEQIPSVTSHRLTSGSRAVIAMSDGLLKHLSRQEVFTIIDQRIKQKKDADSIITDILNAVSKKYRSGYLDDISISLTLLPQEQEQQGFWDWIIGRLRR